MSCLSPPSLSRRRMPSERSCETPALHEESAALQRLAHSPYVGGHDGLPAGHGLYHGEREPFGDAAEGDHVAGRVGLLGLLRPSHEVERAFEVQVLDRVCAPLIVLGLGGVAVEQAPHVLHALSSHGRRPVSSAMMSLKTLILATETTVGHGSLATSIGLNRPVSTPL